MNDTELIKKYFPHLSGKQIEQFDALGVLYPEWNEKINVISRKDIGNLYPNHILHSLSIAKFIDFKDGSEILDLGTGGGFPGIPLAIMFPNVGFLLVDRTGKKVKVAESIAQAIGLQNVATRQADSAEVKETFDFVVSRAVMPLPDLISQIRKNIKKQDINSLPNGLICLKGGDLSAEIHAVRKKILIENISTYFDEDYFDTKKVVYLSL